MESLENYCKLAGDYGAWKFEKADAGSFLERSEALKRLFWNAWDTVVDARNWANSMLALQVHRAKHPISPTVCADNWLHGQVMDQALLIVEFEEDVLMQRPKVPQKKGGGEQPGQADGSPAG